MNGNIIDYIEWRGDLSFEQCPLNNVDAEIFAHLSYNKIEGLLDDSFSNQITIKELQKKFLAAEDYEERIQMGAMLNPDTPKLLAACASSERFGNIKICGLKSVLDFQKDEQFAAVTFLIGKSAIIVFRGTDDYVVGWREDFNIAFMEQIPGQKDAQAYLEAAGSFFKKDLYVAGHSKGGNLALYAASTVDKKLQKRIMGVYNLDGPGFNKEFFSSEGYLRIKDCVTSIYPACDIVGMLFNHDSNYQIIKSKGTGVLQHDGLLWQDCGNDFVPCSEFTSDSKIFEKAFNEWCDNLTVEDKKHFVDGVFDVFEASGYPTLYEISKNSIKASKNMIETYAKLDSETKSEVKRIFGAFMHVVKKELPIFNFMK